MRDCPFRTGSHAERAGQILLRSRWGVRSAADHDGTPSITMVPSLTDASRRSMPCSKDRYQSGRAFPMYRQNRLPKRLCPLPPCRVGRSD